MKAPKTLAVLRRDEPFFRREKLLFPGKMFRSGVENYFCRGKSVFFLCQKTFSRAKVPCQRKKLPFPGKMFRASKKIYFFPGKSLFPAWKFTFSREKVPCQRKKLLFPGITPCHPIAIQHLAAVGSVYRYSGDPICRNGYLVRR